MARSTRLPYGLPPDLTTRIAVSPGGAASLGALGFSLKSAFKAVTKTVAKAAQIAVAPVTTSILAPVKATTWLAAQTGIKPLQKLDSAVRTELRTAVTDLKTGAPIAAGVGLTVLTGGAGAAAFIPAGIELLQASVPKKPAAAPPDVQPPIMASMAQQVQALTPPAPQVEVAQAAGIDPVTGKPTAAAAAGQPVAQAGMAPSGSNLPLILGGVAAVGILAILLMPRRKGG